MNKNSIQSVPAGEESSKASATNPSLTQTMIRIILDATIRSSDVNYNSGTVRSRTLIIYAYQDLLLYSK
jgi:hypothetical protein